MLALMLLVSYMYARVANSITDPIIELYQRIKIVIESDADGDKDQDFDLMLNYEERNNETNELYLAFSKMAKTIKFARTSLVQGDDNKALLKYHEVAEIFADLENMEKNGSCHNNLGCIYLKKNQYEMASIFLSESIRI